MQEKSPNSDPLDALLDQARWPEADADRLQRLQLQWQQVSADPSLQKPYSPLTFFGRRPARGLFLCANAAAIILIAFGFLATRFSPTARESAERSPRATEDYTEPKAVEKHEPPLTITISAAAQADTLSPALVREPNAMELALVARHRNRLGMPEQLSAPEVSATAAQDQASLKDTAELLKALSVSRVSKRLEAANQLAAKQDPQVSAYLIQMTQNEAVRREALIALSLSTDQVAQRFLQHASQDLTLAPSLRAIQTMLSRR